MTDDEQATVFLLTQNKLLGEALARILAKKTDLVVVGSCALSDRSLKDIISAAPDILVMDFFNTNVACVELVREVQQNVKAIKLILIGMDTDRQHFLQAIREGALGYVVKDASALEVVAAVRTVAN